MFDMREECLTQTKEKKTTIKLTSEIKILLLKFDRLSV